MTAKTKIAFGEIDTGVTRLGVIQIVAGDAGDLSIQQPDIDAENFRGREILAFAARRRIGNVDRMGAANRTATIQAAGNCLCHGTVMACEALPGVPLCIDNISMMLNWLGSWDSRHTGHDEHKTEQKEYLGHNTS
ncbi:hypothetical protein [Geotalea toluenoxydans]|uniref:hypothetical protein n=1 Tax=Geotalea toluenoxydans TaxID=421624 RepID=UPI0006D0A35E|nr:hypothetical protein [Geotalea toluenoxydans]